MCLFRKPVCVVLRKGRNRSLKHSISNFTPTFLSLLGKVIVLVALFGSFPNLHNGLCGDNPGIGIGETKTDNSVNRTESDINIGAWFASFFSKHISAVDGDRCPSNPTCSSYSAQAFKKHGFFVGWVMTVDRLIHEGDEGDTSPLVRRNGRFTIVDPVENNDFWWYSKDGQD